MKEQPLSEDLELQVLGAMLQRQVPLEIVTNKELSKLGQIVYSAISLLLSDDKSAQRSDPLSLQLLGTTMVETLNADPEETDAYLDQMPLTATGQEVATLLRKVRDRKLLLSLIEKATEQMVENKLDSLTLSEILESRQVEKLEPATHLLVDGIPSPPTGHNVASLPFLCKSTGGVYGLWAMAGEPAVGKSTLAAQLAISIAQQIPTIYYDFENGPEVMLYRWGKVLNDDVEKLRKKTEHLYLRHSVATLDTDLQSVPPPALIVVDSLQKLPTSVQYKRASLDKWLHKFEMIKQKGYTVILVSEKDRANYGIAKMSGFKETGEIEYTADVGVQLIAPEPGVIELHVVKNRHRPVTGRICNLERVNTFAFKETACAGSLEVFRD